MPSPQLVTLFHQSTVSARSRVSFVFSITLHVAAMGGISAGILENPRIVEAIGRPYAVQIVQMRALAAKPLASDRDPDGLAPPVLHADAQTPAHGWARSTHASGARAAQILLQPNAPVFEIREALVPSLLILSPRAIIDVRHIVPQPAALEAHGRVRPIPDLPAAEVNLADVQISPADSSSDKLNLPSASTTPVALQAGQAAGPPPQTRSDAGPQPTAARVFSLSDLQLTSGSFPLPHIATAGSAADGLSTTGSGASTAAPPSSSLLPSTGARSTQSSDSSAPPPGLRRISLPKDGNFSAVVVGNSLEEAYPETAGIWRGRPTYTVYLHVGFAKSWILQYSLPRAAQAVGTAMVTRLEAPWPTDIMVPTLEPMDQESDAVMVHGFINAEGRFEQVDIVLPPEFPRSSFILDALRQWIFRPARQNGQAVSVEILLMIPSQNE